MAAPPPPAAAGATPAGASQAHASPSPSPPRSSAVRLALISSHLVHSQPITIPSRRSNLSDVATSAAPSVQGSPTGSPSGGSPFSLPGTPGAGFAAQLHMTPAVLAPSGVLYELPMPVSEADPHLVIRRARVGDYEKGHCALLGQLTQMGEMDAEKYAHRMHQLLSLSETYHLLVIEDLDAGAIIGSATLVVEWKLVHSAGAAGHIEDVVVKDGYRGKNLGLKIVAALHDIARQKGCYKVMLDCSEANTTFYSKLGYRVSDRHMRIDL